MQYRSVGNGCQRSYESIDDGARLRKMLAGPGAAEEMQQMRGSQEKDLQTVWIH
jgi:hypothetical protein